MAQLNPETFELTAALSAISLTTAVRLKRNFINYRLKRDEHRTISRDELLELCSQLSFNSYSLVNLLESPDFSTSPFLISTANRINDLLEELHRKILCFDPDDSVNIIRLMDQLRRKWQNYLMPEFYDQKLIFYLNRKHPETLMNLRKQIHNLPPSTTI